MTIPLRLSVKLPVAVPFMVALLAVVFWAEAAEGSCGDYLHRKTKENAAAESSGFHHGGTALLDAAPWTHPESPPKPCSGPGCRSLPTGPLLPLASMVHGTRVNDVVAVLQQTNCPVVSSDRRLPVPRDVVPDRGFPQQIEIPPECD